MTIKQQNKRLVKKRREVIKSPIHYSRTMTTDNLSKAANTVGEWVLTGLGKAGQAFNELLTSGASTDFGLTSPFVMSSVKERRAIQKGKLKALQKANEKITQGMTWISPLNYGAAIWNGHGLNAKKGEEEVASWSPAWQAVGRVGELYLGPKVVKGIKSTPKAVVNTAAKAGVKPAKAVVLTREINKGIKQNTKNGRIEVTEEYFNSPDKWYRVTEIPEKIGILELGRNVTTRDIPETVGTAGSFRRSILKDYTAEDGSHFKIVPGKGDNEGYFIKTPNRRRFSLSKLGAAHGNTSQAAKGQIWRGTFAYSGKFPKGVLEGQAPTKIFRGMTKTGADSRTNFILQDWEDVPLGARVGFHTGEMPMSNLGWFQKTNKGTYTYEPIIPEKRITYQSMLLLEVPTSLKFFERKPSRMSQITTENAASMTPAQWTAAQDAAIARGDMVEARRLRDLHFMTKAPNATSTTGKEIPQTLYHTGRDNILSFRTPESSAKISFDEPYRNISWAEREGYNITPEELAKYNNGETAVVYKPTGVYLSDDLITSKTYLGKESDVNTTYPLFVNLENPLISIGKGKQLYSDASSVRQLQKAIDAGNDGVFLKNIKDYGPNDAERVVNGVWQDSPSTSVVVFDPRRMKSADAVTFDDKGIRIPLGKRDNFNINDIRYGLLPFGIGLTGYELFGNQKH